MKTLVVGAGSIGQRHLSNFKELGITDLSVVDADPARAAAAAAATGAKVYATLDAALADQPELAVLCTPTSLHIEQALACARAGCHLFIEKPLSHSLEGTELLLDETRRRGLHAMVGCNLRFDAVYQRVSQTLHDGELGRVYMARFYFGHDLADWRPGVDYRTVYSAHRAQGGGVVLDAAIHEIDLALRWFGEPSRLLSLPRRTGALEADVEDVIDLTMEFHSGVVASLHLNYRDPVYRRSVYVAGDNGVCEADFARRTVLKRFRDGREIDEAVPLGSRNDMYLEQARHFLGVIGGTERPIATLEDSMHNLSIALDSRDRAPIATIPRRDPAVESVPVVIQARMGSTRLPGKVLKDAAGKSMLEHLVERLRRAKRVDGIYLATSELSADDPICAMCERIGVPYFRGSETDVLSRYVGALRKFDLDAVVRITADCPLHDPDVVDHTIGVFVARRPDYCSNVVPRAVPDGFDVEVVTRRAIETADRDATEKPDREHVTRYLHRHPERFEIVAAYPANPEFARHRWTLDTPADYAFIKAVFEGIYPEKPDFRSADILAYLARRPELERTLFESRRP